MAVCQSFCFSEWGNKIWKLLFWCVLCKLQEHFNHLKVLDLVLDLNYFSFSHPNPNPDQINLPKHESWVRNFAWHKRWSLSEMSIGPEVAPDPEWQSRFRPDSAFFSDRTRQSNICEKPDRSHFSISGVAGVCVVKTWVNYDCIDDSSRSLNRSRILKFETLPNADPKFWNRSGVGVWKCNSGHLWQTPAEVCEAQLCSHTFSVSLNPETSMALI